MESSIWNLLDCKGQWRVWIWNAPQGDLCHNNILAFSASSRRSNNFAVVEIRSSFIKKSCCFRNWWKNQSRWQSCCWEEQEEGLGWLRVTTLGEAANKFRLLLCVLSACGCEGPHLGTFQNVFHSTILDGANPCAQSFLFERCWNKVFKEFLCIR